MYVRMKDHLAGRGSNIGAKVESLHSVIFQKNGSFDLDRQLVDRLAFFTGGFKHIGDVALRDDERMQGSYWSLVPQSKCQRVLSNQRERPSITKRTNLIGHSLISAPNLPFGSNPTD